MQVGRYAQALRILFYSLAKAETMVGSRSFCAIYDAAHSADKLSVDTVAVDSTLVESKKRGEFSSYTATKKRKGVKFMHQ